MAKLGKCPDCPAGTGDRLLIGGKCPFHFSNPANSPQKGKILHKTESEGKKATSHSPQKKVKPRKPIAKRSKKKIEADKAYSVLRADFLKTWKLCEAKLEGCKIKANQVHHLHSGKSRSKYYLDTTTWIAICPSCHHKVHNQLSEEEARTRGLKL